jgi:hypothetical protein
MKTHTKIQSQPTRPAKLALSKETIRLLTGNQSVAFEPATRTRLC